MSLSLYGDLPKPKTTNPEETKGGDPTKASSLYGDLPKPAGSSSATSGASPSAPAVPHYAQMLHLHTVLLVNRYSNIPPTNKLFHNAAVIIHSIPGWSAITQFKPIIRKPVIQAKPKLHKPTSAPASLTGPPATSLSHQIVYSAPPTASQHDAAPTGQGPGKSFGGKLVSEDVNGFKAINNLKEKVDHPHIYLKAFPCSLQYLPFYLQTQKKNKGKTKQGQNQPLPQPSMDEDYDPFRPNDYEIYKATEKKRKEELAAERETQRRHIYRSNSRSKSRSRSRSGSRSQSRSKSRSRTPEERDYRRHINQFAPPPTLYERDTSSPYEEDVFMQATTPPPPPQLLPAVSPAAGPAQVVNLGESADEAWMRRARMSGKPVVLEPKRSPEPERMGLGLGGGGSGQDVARRLMSKYGWQEGQGLGKSEDGIREALQVQQTGRGAGVIVNTSASPSFVAASPPSRVPLNPVVPTKVILLTNMVMSGLAMWMSYCKRRRRMSVPSTARLNVA
ncbi:LOW QUALITY PROTEIN: hypothetical protein BC936DRAFT_142137 [Jimgerdemannia flammicorona]|uniref:G-patch domain-containing protein n=1 Tax=Jimgerdemannia flammicorona TaxID=994334 RepID=A0A433A0Y1_9FUNG|nr:LOW QUALITY PROTEIN: hypothetical protein BC936DRAFT_142137 [Jimgerdemannia flammicorona]